MRALRNSFYRLMPVILLSACTTSFYRVKSSQGLKAELIATPDRVAVECGRVADNSDAYMLSVLILDENDSVLSASQGHFGDKKTCENWRSRIARVLKTGQTVTIGGMGHPNEPKQMQNYSESIPGRGKFRHNGRYLQLMVVYNENGQCYGAYLDKDDECPGTWFGKSSTPTPTSK